MLNVILERVVPGQFENDYGGFQQYTKAIASTVAKVNHFPIFFWGISANASVRFLPTFRTMKLLLCPSASRHRTSVCTIESLLDLVWFLLYLQRERESMLETPFSSSVDPAPLARMVSRHWHCRKRSLPIASKFRYPTCKAFWIFTHHHHRFSQAHWIPQVYRGNARHWS